jgi:DinB superfamily
MAETAQEYIKRMLSLVEGKDAIKVQAATPAKLRRMVKSQPRRVLTRRPAPGKWSVAEIVAHLADAEVVHAYRIRMILSRDGTEIQAFDQNVWAEGGRYHQVDVNDALNVFQSLRRANLAFVKRLTPAERKRHGMHQERGKETIEHIGRMYAGHDLNHLGQIETILRKA